MKPAAYCYVRKDDCVPPKWPGIWVKQGLEKVGYENRCKYMVQFENGLIYPFDLIITWTLWKHCHRRYAADEHKKLGGSTLCMENGFLRSIHGRPYYQLGWRVGLGSGINGQGSFPAGDDSRWKAWNVDLKPWRSTGSHILVCAQRGVRPDDPDITHGSNWPDSVIPRIRAVSDRPIWFRPHPGNKRPCLPKNCKVDRIIDPEKESLEQNLKDAWCSVVYTSTAATDSIVNGIPVCYDGPKIMCHELAGRVKDMENPPMLDREEVFSRLAWGQWNLEELASGEAFRHVLQ